MAKSKMIGLVGPSASGKSTLGARAAREFPGVELIKLDKFFKERDQFPRIGEWPNWEAPESLKLDELYKCLVDLKSGRAAKVPLYSKLRGKMTGTRVARPARIILAEGFLLLHDSRIRALFDHVIYLKADAPVLWERRLKREPEISKQYYETVIVPAFERYGAEAEQLSDSTIDANGSENQVWNEFHRLFKF